MEKLTLDVVAIKKERGLLLVVFANMHACPGWTVAIGMVELHINTFSCVCRCLLVPWEESYGKS
jgi:hypothetical protein